MKRFSPTLFLVLLVSTCFAQQDWRQMIKDPEHNFYTINQVASAEFSSEEKRGKGTGYKQYMRWADFAGPRAYPSGDLNFQSKVWEAYVAYYGKGKKRTKRNGDWQEMGPATMANVTSSWAPGVGRISCIEVDPNNSNTLYIGSPSGGIWKSSNGGGTWNSLAEDDLPIMGVNSITVDPNNTSTIYIATGDENWHTYSIGVMKSTNGGQSWELTGLDYSIIRGKILYKVLAHPTQSGTVLAAATDGIYRTTNGGDSWTRIFTQKVEDMEFKPGDPNTVYASGEGFFKSTDGGASFSSSGTGFVTSNMRTRLCVSEAAPNNVYLLRAQDDNQGSYGGVYVSTNSGSTFSSRHTSPALFDFDLGGTHAQSWWNISFAVSHTNANEIHVGGKVNYVSTDGGYSFTQTSQWTWGNSTGYTHADQQSALAVGGTIYIGSDGMLVKTTNAGSSYTNLTEGLGIRQFNRIGITQSDNQIIGGGSQDNGTSFYDNGTWYEWLGADGSDFCISPTDKNRFYGGIQNGGNLQTSNNGGSSYTNMTSPPFPYAGAWVLPMAVDQYGGYYTGYQTVYKTNNSGGSWTTYTGMDANVNIVDMAVSPSNANYVYAVEEAGSITPSKVYAAINSTNFQLITNGLPGPEAAITYIGVHPTDPETIAVTYSGYEENTKVYISTNAGSSWQNITNDLPNVPVNTVAFQIQNNGIYVGTDMGCYYTDDNLDGSWVDFNGGLPRVMVKELEINHNSKEIFAATFGRGLWKADLLEEVDASSARFSSDVRVILPQEEVQFTDESSINGVTITGWSWTFEGGSPSSSTAQNPTVKYNDEGSYDVSLTISLSDGTTATSNKSNYIEVSKTIALANRSVETCIGTFYDAGIDVEYGDEEDYVMTFTSKDPNSPIQFDFTAFDVEFEQNCDYDYLEVYDGTSTNASLIGKYCGSNSPGTITSTNPEHALTFKFHSDQNTIADGWVAEISCPLSSSLQISPYMEDQISLFPNPAQENLTVQLDGTLAQEASQLTVLSTTGKVVYAQSLNAEMGSIVLPVQNWAPGIYYVTVHGSKGALSKKVQVM